MVLYIVLNEKDVEGLRERGRRAIAAYLGNEVWHWHWPSLVWVNLVYAKRLYVVIKFVADAVGVMQYFHYSNSSQQLVFSLDIKARQRTYYAYDWCKYPIYAPGGKSLNNIWENRNNYETYKLGELSLKPPPSLYTIVPTQLSSLV